MALRMENIVKGFEVKKRARSLAKKSEKAILILQNRFTLRSHLTSLPDRCLSPDVVGPIKFPQIEARSHRKTFISGHPPSFNPC